MILLPPTSLWLAAAAPPPDPPVVLSDLAAFTVTYTSEGNFTIKDAAPDARYTWPPPSRTHRRGWKAGRSR